MVRKDGGWKGEREVRGPEALEGYSREGREIPVRSILCSLMLTMGSFSALQYAFCDTSRSWIVWRQVDIGMLAITSSENYHHLLCSFFAACLFVSAYRFVQQTNLEVHAMY